MAFQAATYYKAAYKKLNQKAHTTNDKEPANEARSSQVLLDVSQVIGEKIDSDPATSKDINTEYVLCDMYVDVTSNGDCWIAKFPAAYTGFFGAGAQGDDISDYTFAIPAAFNTSLAESDHSGGYAPTLYDDAVHHAEPGSEDYFFDPFACVVTSEDDLHSGSTWTLGIYLYTGVHAPKVNRSTSAPTVNDDTGDGYEIGSIWVHTSGSAVYICLDASSGAADWNQIDSAGGGASQLSDLSDVTSATQTDGFVLQSGGGDYSGAQLSHTKLGDKGTNTHADIDTHVDGDGSDHSDVVINSTHVAGDGSDHSDVALNTTHSGSDGSDHSDVVDNTTHSGSDGSDHSDVVLNTTHRGLTNDPHSTVPIDDGTAVVKGSGDATKLVRIEADNLSAETTRVITMPDADVNLALPAINYTHATGDGSDHSDVVDNTTHSGSDGSDHSDVVTNTTHRGLTDNPHATDIENLGAGTLTELNAAVSDETIVGRDTTDTLTNKSIDASQLTGTISGARLAAKHKRVSGHEYIEYPTAADDYPLKSVPDDITLTEVFGITEGSSTSITFQLVYRARTSPWSGGTTMLTDPLVADNASGDSTDSFADATVPADNVVSAVASAISGIPTKLLVCWKGTIDD